MERFLLKEVALDQRAVFEGKPLGTPRAALTEISRHVRRPHAVTITGVRRCGKSTLMRQMAERYYSEPGRGRYYYFQFEDERLLGFSARDFNLLHAVLIECFGEQEVFLLDEVQVAPGWEAFVRRMMEAGKRFVVTGSNTALLGRELGTKLTGRHLNLVLYPFSFRELLLHRGVEVEARLFLESKGRAALARHLADYRLRGGFPEPLVYDSPELLTQLYDDIIFRDVAARHELKNTRALRELAVYYMSNVATLASFNRLKATLGLGSTTTVSAYTDFLEQAFVLKTLAVLDPSIKRQSIAPKKVYAIDTGLANRVSLSFSKNVGALTENLVMLELLRRGHDLSYCKTASGREVDFACRQGRRVVELIQVSMSLADPAVRERETRALAEAMHELDLEEGLILAESEHEDLVVDGRTIRVRPLLRWLCAID
jgi:hypothetical protein